MPASSRTVHAVADICIRLDGIPLAIELAASRIRLFQPEIILDRLHDRFRLLTGGSRTAIERHKTLRATIDWSYDLLSEKEKVLFRRLSVFVGGCELEAAEKICCGDPLNDFEVIDLFTGLVDKSLVVTTTLEDGTNRYHLLETIQHYANQKLVEAGEAVKTRQQHFDYYLALAEGAFIEQIEKNQYWAYRIEIELENFEGALDWTDSETDRLQMAGALGWFWYDRSLITTGLKYLNGCDKYETDRSPSLTRARLYFGYLAALQGNMDGFAVIEKAFNYLQTLNERIDWAFINYEYSMLQGFKDNIEAALKAAVDAQRIGENLHNKHLTIRGRTAEAQIHIFHLDVEKAEPIVEQSLQQATDLNLPREKAENLHLYADCAIIRRDFKIAEQLYGITLTGFAEINNKRQVLTEMTGMAFALAGL